jgi:hypothetical protein
MAYTCLWTGHIWQSFTMTSHIWFESRTSLVHVFHTIPHTGLSLGSPYTIPVNISIGTVGYCTTTTIIKLHRFTGSNKDRMQSVHFKYLLKVPLWKVPNWHGRGLAPWCLEYPHPSPRPSYPKILHFLLVVPSGLKINHQYKTSNKTFLIPLVWKRGSYMWVGPTTQLLPLCSTKNSTSNDNIYLHGNKDNLEG